MSIPELGEHLPPLSALRVFLQSSAGEEEQLMVLPESDLGNWTLQENPNQCCCICSSAAPGWAQGAHGSPSLWSWGKTGLKIDGSREKRTLCLSSKSNSAQTFVTVLQTEGDWSTGFSKGRDTSNPPFQMMNLIKCRINGKSKNPRLSQRCWSHPIPCTHPVSHFTSFPSLLQADNSEFLPLQAIPQGSSILRSVLGFIQPPCSNVSTEESSEPPSHSQPWQLLHTNKCKCTEILLLLTRLATSLKLCREAAGRKTAFRSSFTSKEINEQQSTPQSGVKYYHLGSRFWSSGRSSCRN